jgi:hypothetical protein
VNARENPRNLSARMPLGQIDRGTARVLFAYDIGLSIELEKCKQFVAGLTADERIKHKGIAPQYFQFDPKPLHVLQGIDPIEVGRWKSTSSAEITIFDFGGVSVAYEVPFSGSCDDLIELSCTLAGLQAFRKDSRARVEKLLDLVRDAVTKPGVAPLDEDYLVFQTDALPGVHPSDLDADSAQTLARVLRSESDPLSEQEVQEALAGRISFGSEDVALIDWNAALLVDKEPEDVLAVLEFANLQLLEVRFLDAQLDHALDRAYESSLKPRGWKSFRLPGTSRQELRRVAQMKVDGAILFERVSNAIKMLGDQYLARVYRQISQRFRVQEWNAAILRKLDTIDSIYQKLHDHSTSFRMEVLEWIVILLIASEIVLAIWARATLT